VASNDILKSIEQYVDGQDVEYRDTKMAGPFPYLGGDVALFVGLFRTKTSDLAVQFCSFLGGLAKTFDVSGLTRYLDLVGPLAKGLEGFLGMKDVEFCLGVRQEFRGSTHSGNEFKNGVWAYINAPFESIKKSELRVRDGMLETGSGEEFSRFKSSDYCLVDLVRLEERGDYTTLPFHAQWNKAKQMIWAKEVEKAKICFISLSQDLASSPDLTRKHRFALMQAYKANFEKELEAYRSWTSPAGTADNYRAGDEGAQITAQLAIQKQYSILERVFPDKSMSGFYEIRGLLPSTPEPPQNVRDFLYTDLTISKQLSEIRAKTQITDPDPEKLAKALTIVAFRA
jgi:hypothetical protein